LAAGVTTSGAYADDGANDGRFQFALWGDTPYARNGDNAKIPALIDSMNAQHLAFTVFDGDTKDGSSACTDDTIGAQATLRFNQFRAPTATAPTTAAITRSNASPTSVPISSVPRTASARRQ